MAAKDAEKVEEVPRARVGESRCVGLVTEWRGYMGWIQPLTKLDHDQAEKHKGRVYLNMKDIVAAPGRKVKEGSVVDYFLYTDHDGLGAEDCQLRTVLRMTLPHSEVAKFKLKPSWSDFFTDSEYYPDFVTDHNVLLRKYTWQLPFALLELWGEPDTISKAAVHLATTNKEKADEECSVRLILPEAESGKVAAIKDAKLSPHPVVTTPARCKNLIITGSKERCLEATKEFIQALTPA